MPRPLLDPEHEHALLVPGPVPDAAGITVELRYVPVRGHLDTLCAWETAQDLTPPRVVRDVGLVVDLLHPQQPARDRGRPILGLLSHDESLRGDPWVTVTRIT
jgi:hypothetical protein